MLGPEAGDPEIRVNIPRAVMLGRASRNPLPSLRALQGVVVGTVISLALFIAAVHLTGFSPGTDEEGGGLYIGFFALTAAGAAFEIGRAHV